MLMTINRCIDYTKASKGMKLVPRCETVDLREALNLPLTCMRNIQHRVEIVLKPVPRNICSHIITDKQWLQENILCLLSNSVKYSTDGYVSITLSLKNMTVEDNDGSSRSNSMKSITSYALSPWYPSTHRIACSSIDPKGDVEHNVRAPSDSNVHFLIEIEDTGVGMSEEAMSTLFSPFKQTQRLAGGTGLGLFSLAKRVEALQGEYGVRKRKDGKKGSMFWFSFPYKPDNEFAASLREKSTHKRAGSNAALNPSVGQLQTNSKLEILIVDDAPSIVKLTVKTLQKLGYYVETAENGEVAVNIIEQRWKEKRATYDIVLMDLQMPVMDGLEATKRLRQMQQVSKQPSNINECDDVVSVASADFIEPLPCQRIIGLSANSDHDTMESAFKAGIDAFMPKPFRIDTFHDMLRQLGIKVSS